jgi:hypothetical protein
MKKTYKILSEKYVQVLNEKYAAVAGLDKLAKEVNLINFFKWLGDVPDKYSTTLDNTLTNYAEGLTDSLAADANILDDDIQIMSLIMMNIKRLWKMGFCMYFGILDQISLK